MPRQVSRWAELERAKAEERILELREKILARSRSADHTEGMATKRPLTTNMTTVLAYLEQFEDGLTYNDLIRMSSLTGGEVRTALKGLVARGLTTPSNYETGRGAVVRVAPKSEDK